MIRRCWEGLVGSSASQIPYNRVIGLAKKQDDYGDEAIQAWLMAYKIEPIENRPMKTWTNLEVEKFVQDFIEDLPKNQLTSANIESVKQRFRELSRASSRAQHYLLQEIKNLEKIDRVFRKTLVSAVIASFTYKI